MLVAFVLHGASASAQQDCAPIVGRIASLEGEVDVQRSDSGSWQPAELAQQVCEGDSVRTGSRSRGAVALVNDAVLRIDESTTLRLIDIVEEEGTSFLELVRGIFQSFSRSPRTLAIDTPYMNATIEGTEFVLEVADDRSSITVLEGVVAVENAQGQARVASGGAAVAEAGQAPRAVTVVTPRDAVQWSLYYPPIIALRATPGSGLDPDPSPPLRRALELAGEGRVSDALASLEEVPPAARDATWHVYRASLLLSVGQVGAAEQAIERALAADPDAGTAHALQAIIDLVQNREEEALAAARRAVEASPEASAPKVALSYALQARFDLEAARDVLLEAVEQDPDNPLLWARLAELHLSLGERRAAREAAERAVELASVPGAIRTTGRTPHLVIVPAAYARAAAERRGAGEASAPSVDLAQATPAPRPTRVRSPELERALVVLGFANLAEFDTAQARGNFARAIELDPADPLAHFGIGLAQIRDGELEQGRQNIEVAVALDANSSILRSYLGKAYFEEKRSPLDAQQFEIAKELDPRDPTPYLYDAIRKQTDGRPVEALQDLQRSIELNDNRAVYRSRLQLDEDRAARATSLARIYDDLGFQELGLKEASKSLASDPTSASSHRFLSDVYGGLRRRESARVSELLQAQMLQQVNINPLQPSASETNLNIVTTGGPAEVGFNEFTPLFERDQVQVNASGLAGDEDTYGGEAVASALYDRFSVSAGYFHYETNGWRENGEIEHDIYNFFFQTAITPELNAQVELRRRETDLGDLALNFDPDLFFPNFQRSNDRDIARAGVRYSPTPNSDVLLSFIYTNNTDFTTDLIETGGEPISVLGDLDDEGYQVEAQYLWNWDRFDLIAGAAFSDFDLGTNILAAMGDQVLLQFNDPEDLTQIHPYVYGQLNLPDPVVWTVGLSYDDVERDFENAGSFEVDELNPKFGVQWSLTDDLLLRGTVLKFVKPFLAADRSLEPTQVAGFNQLYDDRNFVPSWRYGVGLDWQGHDDLFLGLEGNWRDLEIPFVTTDAPTEFSDWKEQTYGVYLNWTPLSELALAVGLSYDRFKADDSVFTVQGEVPQKLETWSVPLQARYFHPSGFFAGAGVTYVHQDVERDEGNLLGLGAAQGEEDFFVIDLAAGYRLPRRLGVVSLEVANLLDEDFFFQDDSFREFQDRPSIGPYIPDRQIIGRLTLNW